MTSPTNATTADPTVPAAPCHPSRPLPRLPKVRPTPGGRDHDDHSRVRRDRVDKTGTVTLRVHGKLRHIGIGRAHARTYVLILANDLDIAIINAAAGELLRELTIDLARDYQPRTIRNPRT